MRNWLANAALRTIIFGATACILAVVMVLYICCAFSPSKRRCLE